MKSFVKRKKSSEDMSLQITSMADIFMILLVFLLKNYSTSISNISPNRDTRLPVALSQGQIQDTLKVEISSSAILVDQKQVVPLKHFDFKPGAVADNGNVPPLFQTLFSERKKIPIANMESNLLVLADEKTPYSTLKPVLASAAAAGFVDLQLVVVQEE